MSDELILKPPERKCATSSEVAHFSVCLPARPIALDGVETRPLYPSDVELFCSSSSMIWVKVFHARVAHLILAGNFDTP